MLRSRIVAALFPMLAPEDLVLNAVSEFTLTKSIKKHTKLDKVDFFLVHGGISLYSANREYNQTCST